MKPASEISLQTVSEQCVAVVRERVTLENVPRIISPTLRRKAVPRIVLTMRAHRLCQ
jgi:hypothetical protein